MITAGTYKGYADPDSVDVGVSSNGNDTISFYVTLSVVGERVKVYLTITEKTQKWVWKKLAECGWDGDDLDALDGFGSKECTVIVKEETWNGQARLRADIATPRDRGTGGLAAKYGKQAREVVGGGFKL